MKAAAESWVESGVLSLGEAWEVELLPKALESGYRLPICLQKERVR